MEKKSPFLLFFSLIFAVVIHFVIIVHNICKTCFCQILFLNGLMLLIYILVILIWISTTICNIVIMFYNSIVLF